MVPMRSVVTWLPSTPRLCSARCGEIASGSSATGLADLIEPNVIHRFVLFLDHGDTTLRDIDDGLRLKREYLQRLHLDKLGNRDGVERYLEFVRTVRRRRTPACRGARSIRKPSPMTLSLVGDRLNLRPPIPAHERRCPHLAMNPSE